MARTPLGLRALTGFFVFGSIMSATAGLGLLFPNGPLESIWQFNPESHEALSKLGGVAVALMVVVSTACALSAIGLLNHATWGLRFALGVLAVNLVGDIANAIVRSDLRTLIGLPIGSLLIAYLLRPGIRGLFKANERA
jgi:hypothetical protein